MKLTISEMQEIVIYINVLQKLIDAKGEESINKELFEKMEYATIIGTKEILNTLKENTKTNFKKKPLAINIIIEKPFEAVVLFTLDKNVNDSYVLRKLIEEYKIGLGFEDSESEFDVEKYFKEKLLILKEERLKEEITLTKFEKQKIVVYDIISQKILREHKASSKDTVDSLESIIIVGMLGFVGFLKENPDSNFKKEPVSITLNTNKPIQDSHTIPFTKDLNSEKILNEHIESIEKSLSNYNIPKKTYYDDKLEKFKKMENDMSSS